MRTLLLLLGIALGVAATLLLQQPAGVVREQAAGSADDDDDLPSRVRRVEGVIRVELDAHARTLADIVTQPPVRATVAQEEKTFGRVADTTGLLRALSELDAARAAVNAQQGLVGALRQRLERLRGWSARGEITVARELAELELQYRRELDIARARKATRDTLAQTIAAHWGPTLADAATPRPAWLARLTGGGARLIEFGASALPPAGIFANRQPRRDTAVPVQVLGPAPAVLGAAQAATYFGLMQGPALRTGMQLTCWVPLGTAPREGYVVPAAGLVWHGGTQWYFVEVAPGAFERRAATGAVPHADGVLLTQGLAPDSALVVRGAQALLAEEFRRQIPEEDDD